MPARLDSEETHLMRWCNSCEYDACVHLPDRLMDHSVDEQSHEFRQYWSMVSVMPC